MKAILKTKTLLCLIFLSVSSGLHAGNDIQFERIFRRDGLSHSVIYSITQDRQGFMWFSSEDGLNRYNGYEFSVFKHDSSDPGSISMSSQSYIYEDRAGIIWAGTWGGGLNRFDPRTEEFVSYRHDPADPFSLSENHVQFIFEENSSALWIGTFKGGLNKLDRETGQFACYRHDPENPDSISNNRIWSIVKARDGMLFIGTDDGLNLLNTRTGRFTLFRHNPDDPNSLSHNMVRSIIKDHSGIFWIGTEKGLNAFDLRTGMFTRFFNIPSDPESLSENTVNAICEDSAGVLWVGTNGGGLNRFDRETRKFTRFLYDSAKPHSLSENDVRAIYEDRSGNIWVGTRGGGLSKFDRKPEKFGYYTHKPDEPDSLIDSSVLAVYEDQSANLWIGTKEGGLNRLDRQSGKVTRYQHHPGNPNTLGHNRVLAICEDRSGTFWIGHKKGLAKFSPHTGQFANYSHDPENPHSLSGERVLAIREDRSGILWIGTKKGGLNRFDPGTEQFTHYKPEPNNPKSLSDNRVFSICEDRSAVLWIGTGDGLNHFVHQTGQFRRYKPEPGNPKSLSNHYILVIYEDRSGTLWVGTREGLNRMNRQTGEFDRFKERDGLSNHTVNGILEDENGYLWLSTNKGVSRFDPRSRTFRNYDSGDGLKCDEFNPGAYYQNRKGEMFFGGISGVVYFHPDQIRDNPHIPPVVLTAFKKFGKTVSFDVSVSKIEKIGLSYKDSFFSFEFASLDYTFPQKNRYAYKLEGFDRDWIYSGARRFASYTNLDGGEYVFRVTGSNNDGIWNEKGIAIPVTITRRPWKTWWAYTLYMLMSGAALLGYVRYKTLKELEKTNKKLESEIEERKRIETELKLAKDYLENVLDEARTANSKIMESIRYAERIQSSLLPNPVEVKTYLPRSFSIWMPRDVVGGDIFYMDSFEEGFIIALVDCTGHGVPGAFMTMIASSGLRRIIRDEGCRDPGKILKSLNAFVKKTLQQDTAYALSNDGLDAAVCFIGGAGRGAGVRGAAGGSRVLVFAGARLPLFYAHNGEVHVIKGDRQSVGYKRSDLSFDFTDHAVDIEKGICFYLSTDGLWDQLGGEKDISFSKKRFRSLLREIDLLPFEIRREKLLRAFEEYKGENERVDDVTVLGFKV